MESLWVRGDRITITLFQIFQSKNKGKYWNQITASDFELFTHWSGDWNPKISAIIEAFWREAQGDPIHRGGSSIMIASSHGGRRNWNWYWNATSLLMKPPPCFIVQKTSPTNQAEIEKWWQNFFRTFAIFSGISKEKFNFFAPVAASTLSSQKRCLQTGFDRLWRG